jgi:DNA-binding response OmpR family regulator
MSIAVYIRNETVLDHVRQALLRAGFKWEHFSDEVLFMRGIRRNSFDLLVIDIPVEPRDDETIISWLNCRPADTTPVLMTSPVRNAFMAALLLNCGADDVMYRPFEPIEFIARVHALLRRTNRRNTRSTIELGGFLLDRDSAQFNYQGEPIELTTREFSIAWLLFSYPGIYISRETISATIWSTDSEVAARTIEQHIYKLRKKLQLGPERRMIVRTAYNQGYRLEVIEPASDGQTAAQSSTLG